MEYKMLDLPFFLLLFATGEVSYSALKLNQAYRSEFWGMIPPMARGQKASLIITWINIPVYWSNVAVLIYGFFILPWYVVLICLAATLIADAAFYIALKSLLRGFFNPFTAMLVSWAMLLVVVIWYFWFRFRA
jgi:hypothetical protein